jgi:hypothetical protein
MSAFTKQHHIQVGSVISVTIQLRKIDIEPNFSSLHIGKRAVLSLF